jgi:septal ring factor EnvC (AmiA/AmiB activator)
LGDALVEFLPYLPGIPFGLALMVVYRLWGSTVRELRVERRDHNRTQAELDAVRDERRRIEDRVDELTREIRGLKAELRRLQAQVGEAT